ncbi:hypothetical protein GOODEAATRI_025083 [Goodea atripinnis]|uniref:Uncharacterized protein n=1 Tax=Goodea atripinnis TaxID=208336 RepID=A0ABV0P7L2_9TELE
MRQQGECFCPIPCRCECSNFGSLPTGISRALLHNFAGKPSVALEGVKAGYFFSFPPAVCRNQQVGLIITSPHIWTGNPQSGNVWNFIKCVPVLGKYGEKFVFPNFIPCPIL